MANLFDLVAKLTLDSSEYEKEVDKAESKASSFGSKLKSGLGTAAKVGAAGVGAMAGAAVGAATELTKTVSATAQYGDNIDKMSQKMGMSAQAYQEWDAVMQHSGTSMETLKAGMKTLANAAENNNDAFGRLGITQEQIAGMNQEQLFSATISALQNVDNETERTYLAGQLLGRGATELGALLNTSAEDTEKMKQRVHELGGVMSNDAVKASAAFQDNMQDLTTAIDGVKRGFTSALLPGFNDVLAGFTSLIAGEKGAEEQLTGGVSNIVSTFDTMLPRITSVLSGIGTAVIAVAPQIVQGAVSLVQSLAGALISNGPMLIDSAIQIVGVLVDGFIALAPQLIVGGLQLMIQLATGLVQALPELISKIPELISAIVQAFIDNGPQLLEAGKELAKSAWEGIKSIFKGGDKADASESVDFSGLQSKTQQAASSMSSISSAASQTASSVSSSFSSISTAANFTQLGTNATTAFNGISTSAQTAATAVTESFSSVGTGVGENINAGIQSVDWSSMSESASETVTAIENSFSQLPPQLKAIFEMIKQAVRDLHRFVKQQFDQMAKAAVNAWQPVPGQINTYLQQINTNVTTLATNIQTTFTTLANNATQWATDFVANFTAGITNNTGAGSDFANAINNMAQQVQNVVGHSHPKEGPMADDYKWMPDMMKLFAQGIKDNTGIVRDQVERSFNFERPTITYSKVSSSRAQATDRKLDQLTAILQLYLPQLANMQVVMNNGATVGALLPEIDSQLGQLYRVKERAGA